MVVILQLIVVINLGAQCAAPHHRGCTVKKKVFAFLLVGIMLFAATGTAFARGGRHHGGHRGGGGFGWDDAWKFALATAAVSTAVDMARGAPMGYYGGGRYYGGYGYQQPVYYQPPPPVCWIEHSPVFDVYGRPVGTMPVQRCAPY